MFNFVPKIYKLKYIIAFLVLSGVLLQSFSSIVIVAHYEWNKKYITAKYCENKAKPKLQCNGSCHLRKQLIAQDKKEQVPTSPLKDKTENIQYYQAYSEQLDFIQLYSISNIHFNYLQIKPQEVLLSFFHPPAASLTLIS